MADHYLQFSAMLDRLTKREAKWLDEQLTVVCVHDGKEYRLDALPASLTVVDRQWTGCRAYRDMPDYEADFGEDAGFDFAFGQNPGWGQHLWLYAEETACLDRLAHLVQKFLRKFRPDACWSMTYALSCSKPRVDEFGGGAMLVTAQRIKVFCTYDFVGREEAAFRHRSTKGKRLARSA